MEPITRKEKFLAKAGGQNIELPNPVTREEMFLAAIGGGGNKFIAHLAEDDGNLVCDKSLAEIDEAFSENKTVVLDYCGVELKNVSWRIGQYATFSGMCLEPPSFVLNATVTIRSDGTLEMSMNAFDLSSLAVQQ